MTPNEATNIGLSICETSFHEFSPISRPCFCAANGAVAVKRPDIDGALPDQQTCFIFQITLCNDWNSDASRYDYDRIVFVITRAPANSDFERFGGVFRNDPLDHIGMK